ncbi:hypothetical protein [Acidianus brierleyi]|uniref:Uncharacterized protein n=1 Tax=Acidianus brierleyi TaxID=41673 RepID=A0A2U9IIF1_9CREN|nr:hypothetical protein [Acidianus brierleyi]AWR95828.1 hypothetical protein DFR85_15815 [Acidianus brierleyi]
MKIDRDIKLIHFLYLYIFAQFFELFFNREFLVSVLPFGLAGISVTKIEPYLKAFYIIGGTAYTLMLILQPILLILVIIKVKNNLSRGLLSAILYLTLLADAIHIAYGVNNTTLQIPAIFSIIYAILLAITPLYLMIRQNKKILLAIFIPDVLAYCFLISTWLTNALGNSSIGIVSGYSGFLMAYAVLFSGIAFITYSILKKINLIKILPFMTVGLFVAIASAFNLIPGWDFAIGVTFPYIFGILGIRDWMPPIFFLIAAITFGCAIEMRKIDKPLALSVLSILASTLIFDSVPITTYLIAPLVGTTFLYLIQTNKVETLKK